MQGWHIMVIIGLIGGLVGSWERMSVVDALCVLALGYIAFVVIQAWRK